MILCKGLDGLRIGKARPVNPTLGPTRRVGSVMSQAVFEEDFPSVSCCKKSCLNQNVLHLPVSYPLRSLPEPPWTFSWPTLAYHCFPGENGIYMQCMKGWQIQSDVHRIHCLQASKAAPCVLCWLAGWVCVHPFGFCAKASNPRLCPGLNQIENP